MQVTVEIPESFGQHENTKDLAARLKLYTALLMFRSGQLSTGAACEFAGVDRYTFFRACDTHQIPVVDYDPEDLDAELEQLEKMD